MSSLDLHGLSPMQAGMLFNTLLAPGTGVDIEQVVIRCPTSLDAVAWGGAWQWLVDRHEILRTGLHWEGVPVPGQRVAASVDVQPVELDFTGETVAEEALNRWLAADRIRGFDLSAPPLMRLAHARLPDGAAVAVWTFHHVLLDGRSFPLLLREVWDAYRAIRSGDSLPALPAPQPYRRYIEWLGEVDHAATEGFWRAQLAGFRAPTPLVVDHEHRTAPAGEAVQSAVQGEITAELTGRLRARAARSGVTLNTLLQAAWALLLHRYSGEEDIVFGATRACRRSGLPGCEQMAGLFINTLPMRAVIPADGQVEPLLQSLRARSLAQRDREHTPLVQVQAWSEVPRGTPLFETVMVFDTASLDTRMAGHAPVPASYEYLGQTSFPLTLIAYGDERMLVRLEYLRTRMSDTAARRLHGHLLSILAGLADAARTHVGQLPLLSEAEREMALHGWNPVREFPSDQTLHAVFAAQVSRVPSAVAVKFGDRSLAYAELDRRANQLAHRLQAAGVARNQLVALRVERSEAVVIGILGILKSGAAYLPLDPVYPKERIAFMLEDSEVRVAVTEEEFLGDFTGGQVRALTLGESGNAPGTSPRVDSQPDDLAYVIYTSGSTGRPKGVRVTHRNVVRLMNATQPWYGFNEHDVWTLFHSYSFDWTVFELWGALAFGGRLVVVPGMVAKLPDEFRELVQAEGVTVLCQTPSAFRSFIQADSEAPDARYALRYVIFGGEALELQSLAPWFDLHGDECPSLVNMYGITETTVHVTYRPIRRPDLLAGKGSVVGVPIPDLQVYILDRYGDPAPIGVSGEIHVGGAGVAEGYLKRPDLTAQRFVPDPFRRDRQQTMYRSGDLARRLEDGDIECLGRGDDQVKIRGFRIELGEIESQIAAQQVVQAVCVMAREDVPGDKRLAAYVVSRVPVDNKLAARIKAKLRENLPQYMVPADFVFLERLPLTSNGKVDRRALPAPNSRTSGEQRRIVAPATPAEIVLVEAWKSVLRLPEISTEDNFFALGGDSILIIQIISRCRDAGLRVTPRMIFDHPVLAELGSRLGVAAPDRLAVPRTIAAGDMPLSPIQQWFFAHSFEDPGYWNQAYLFRLTESADAARLQAALDAVSAHHDALRLRCTRGADGWRQSCAAAVTSPLSIVDLSQVTDDGLAQHIQALCMKAQATLDFQSGPVMTAVLMRCGPGRPDRMLLAVHHLVIDGVSWRPLLEDLEKCYFGSASSLGNNSRGASFSDWVAALQRFASSPEALSAAGYWQQAGQRLAHPAGREAQVRVVTHAIDADVTHRLLTELPVLFRTQVNDALLAGLLMAERLCGHAGPLHIDLEGHGREEIVGDLDVSHTVGWFTSLFPLSLDAPASNDAAQTLLAVKEQLRKVPHRGLSHGVLRAFAPDPVLRTALAAQPAASLLFNYLGQSDALVGGLRLLQFAPESTGSWHGPRNNRTHQLEALVVLREGRFEVQWSFDSGVVPEARVEELAAAFGLALRQLAALVQPGAKGRRSPSDFPLATLGQAEVDTLWQRYPGLLDAHRLSPMQRLFYSLESAGNAPGLEQWEFRLEGDLDAGRLQKAAQTVVARHTVLRSAFVGDIGREPLQVVLPEAHCDWETADLRGLGDEEQRRLIDAAARENAARPSTLDLRAPLRFDLLRTDEREHVLLWTTHHLCVDGWSWPLVVGEIARVYGVEAAEPVGDRTGSRYADYLSWLSNERPDSTAFWREYLADFRAPLPLRLHPKSGEPASASPGGEIVRLDVAQTAALRKLAREHQVTLNSCVQLAWAVVLHHCSGCADVLFGASFSGRPSELPGVATLVGPCVTNLPVRVRFDNSSQLAELLQSVHRNLSGLATHQYSSPEEIQQQSVVPWRQRLFESLVVFQNYQFDSQALQFGADARCLVAQAPETTSYGLTLAVTPGDVLQIRLLPASGALDAQSLSDYAQLLSAVLSAMAAGTVAGDLTQLTALLPVALHGQAVQLASSSQATRAKPGGAVPESPMQRLVAEIWAELFGVAGLSVDENFFELGGQSLLLIQAHRHLVDRLQRDIPIVTLLQYPTIRTLAKALDGAPAVSDMVSDIAARAKRQLEARRPRPLPKMGA